MPRDTDEAFVRLTGQQGRNPCVLPSAVVAVEPTAIDAVAETAGGAWSLVHLVSRRVIVVKGKPGAVLRRLGLAEGGRDGEG